MVQRFEQLYQEMQTVIETCLRSQLDRLAAIEYCFQIAYSYWVLIADARAGETQCTIDLNKRIKPKFLAEMRYFELCYYAAVFPPGERPADIRGFWMRESNRVIRHIDEHTAFHEYYLQGATHRDAELFAGDPEDVDRYIRILADFLALDRYQGYLERELGRFYKDFC
jgi:hypothetical protein